MVLVKSCEGNLHGLRMFFTLRMVLVLGSILDLGSDMQESGASIPGPRQSHRDCDLHAPSTLLHPKTHI